MKMSQRKKKKDVNELDALHDSLSEVEKLHFIRDGFLKTKKKSRTPT